MSSGGPAAGDMFSGSGQRGTCPAVPVSGEHVRWWSGSRGDMSSGGVASGGRSGPSPAGGRRLPRRRRRCRHGGSRRSPTPAGPGRRRQFPAKVPVHVDVVAVHGRGHGHGVARQPLRVVQRRPVVLLGEQLGNVPQRAQRGVLLEVPGVDHLAGEERLRGVRAELGELLQDPPRRPVRGPGPGRRWIRASARTAGWRRGRRGRGPAPGRRPRGGRRRACPRRRPPAGGAARPPGVAAQEGAHHLEPLHGEPARRRAGTPPSPAGAGRSG